MAMPRPLTRALLFWAFVAFVVWNGFFDAVIRQAEYAYLGRRAMHELGAGPQVTLDVAMADARVLAHDVYFTLKDAGAQMPCVFWRTALARHPGRVEDGMQVVAAGDIQGPLQPGFRLRLRRPCLPQEQDAPEATDFRFPPAFLLLLH